MYINAVCLLNSSLFVLVHYVKSALLGKSISKLVNGDLFHIPLLAGIQHSGIFIIKRFFLVYLL